LAIRVVLSGLALSLGSTPGAAHARDYMSEIITPAGWEPRPVQCAAPKGSSRVELMTPVGWGDAASSDVSWDAPMCSELVVPADWTYAQRSGAHQG
jgi:hypothetical protein